MLSGVRVRFAPSPTGSLHIGGARTALFNYLFARANGGKFILRLEDTDFERHIEGAAQGIIESLRWLGLDWDEGPDKGGPAGPYRQSERLALYRREAERLVASGAAYFCYCTPEELAAEREEARKAGRVPRYSGRCRELTPAERAAKEAQGRKPAVRLRVPPDGQTVVEDLIRGTVVFENATLDDFIIMKSNGVPTYNFACVVDDVTMGVTHVIRAEEHLSNTPKQILVYRALGYPLPAFAHVPMILAPDRSKLSKRHGATGVEEFRSQGYLPEALFNYLALLGWSPGDEREILSREEIIREFSLAAVSKHAAIYDVQKLTWLNSQYINSVPLERLVELALPFMRAAGLIGAVLDPQQEDYVRKVLETVRSRARTLLELADMAAYFFRDDFGYDPKGVKKFFTAPGVAALLRKGREALAGVAVFGVAETEAAYRRLIEAEGISGGALIHPTRLALTGRTVGPGLFDIIALLGKERCLERLERAASWIEANIKPE
ncbi:glutamyl-tRNA synthetase [Thermodesulfitimonas autotrophica]|uniref:Glutamate--tRNA ligase n=1 Tax=Thermodesulfitimonas autotrophica TaxID=1894989 RepID=A0A3N5B2I0_9THEO|nr:glutamate--tRNA ligase [Thermodesulfitimonas autotrophica]RPF49760.1 glutamyl-tRNA synthetase [Thermodesulfitimonas autotrophica]